MDKKQFKEFCKQVFLRKGFRKVKNTYYLAGKDLLCGIDLQKSNFGNEYYVNFCYFIGCYQNSTEFPNSHDSDIRSRVVVMSRTQTYQGKQFLTSQIEYEEYTEDELCVFFDKEFEERILPPIHQGKVFILENLGKLYRLSLNQEEVMRKLQS